MKDKVHTYYTLTINNGISYFDTPYGIQKKMARKVLVIEVSSMWLFSQTFGINDRRARK